MIETKSTGVGQHTKIQCREHYLLESETQLRKQKSIPVVGRKDLKEPMHILQMIVCNVPLSRAKSAGKASTYTK